MAKLNNQAEIFQTRRLEEGPGPCLYIQSMGGFTSARTYPLTSTQCIGRSWCLFTMQVEQYNRPEAQSRQRWNGVTSAQSGHRSTSPVRPSNRSISSRYACRYWTHSLKGVACNDQFINRRDKPLTALTAGVFASPRTGQSLSGFAALS